MRPLASASSSSRLQRVVVLSSLGPFQAHASASILIVNDENKYAADRGGELRLLCVSLFYYNQV
jgi:hypothetical protein